MNKQFKLLEFVLTTFMLTYSIMRFLRLGLCDPSSVCEIVLVAYVDAVTVMRVLLFVLHVCMLRDSECDSWCGDEGGMVVVSV